MNKEDDKGIGCPKIPHAHLSKATCSYLLGAWEESKQEDVPRHWLRRRMLTPIMKGRKGCRYQKYNESTFRPAPTSQKVVFPCNGRKFSHSHLIRYNGLALQAYRFGPLVVIEVLHVIE